MDIIRRLAVRHWDWYTGRRHGRVKVQLARIARYHA